MFERHDAQQTQAPAAGTQAAKASNKQAAFTREWIRPKEVIARFGIPRTRLFALMAQGKVDSLRLDTPGEKQGTRIVRLASITGYLETLLTEQKEQAASKKGGAA